MNEKRYKLKIGGYETRVIERTGTQGRVLALHGWSDNADTWLPVFDALANRDWDLVAVDLPEFGEASGLIVDHPAGVVGQYQLFAQAAIEHFSQDGLPLVVLGHSLGGRSALVGACHLGNRVLRGIVAVAPAPLYTNRRLRWLVQEEIFLPKILKIMGNLPEKMIVKQFVDAYKRSGFARPQLANDAVIRRYARFITRERVIIYASIFRKLIAELHASAEVKNLPFPVVLIWGAQDTFVPIAAATPYRESLPRVEFHILQLCGHAVQHEETAAVAAAVAGLLR